MSWFANAIYLLAAVVYLPVLAYEVFVQGKNRGGWSERLFGPRRAVGGRSGGGLVWVHGVSLGEVNAARRLVEQLERRISPDRLVVSATTDTGYRRACELFGAERVFRYPLDFSWAVNRALDRVDPALIVLMELEVWFNLVTLASRRGTAVCVVNGRLTERSRRRLGVLGPFARRMFRNLSWVGAQDVTTAGRFAELGVARERLSVTGSLKWDTATVADRIDGQAELAAALGLDPARPLWVCGSTGAGEEAMLLDSYNQIRSERPDLQLAIAPRKPERFDEVDLLARQRGFACIRRSGAPDGTQGKRFAVDEAVVFLCDTIGELRKLYALADVVFVGRSLVPLGGSDPMEVAALAKPVIVGPHTDNFHAAVSELAAQTAVRLVHTMRELTEVVLALISDKSSGEAFGRRAREVVLANQGATARTIEALIGLLDGKAGGRRRAT